jgi:hypothetical protein
MGKKIKIPITEEELQELQEGKVFDWNFDGVDVKIYKEEQE